MVSAIKPWLFDPISLLKRDMRNNISLRLSGLADADISYQSQAVVEKVLNAPWFRESHRVSVYMSTKGEIETDRIIEACLHQGKQIYIPQFTCGNPRMRLLKLPPNQCSSLQPTLWGIRQPPADSSWQDYEESESNSGISANQSILGSRLHLLPLSTFESLKLMTWSSRFGYITWCSIHFGWPQARTWDGLLRSNAN